MPGDCSDISRRFEQATSGARTYSKGEIDHIYSLLTTSDRKYDEFLVPNVRRLMWEHLGFGCVDVFGVDSNRGIIRS